MKIVADENIPFLKGVLEPYSDVLYRKGESISQGDIMDADAMIVRTRTKCSGELLENTEVKFIATATIGTDHIDLDFCREHGITVAVASGSNAWGVVQYVISAINFARPFRESPPRELTAGVIGAGNVGERVAYTLGKLGYRVMRCDPPLKEKISAGRFPLVLGPSPVDRRGLTPEDYYGIEEVISSSDILTLHLPLERETKGYIGENYISMLRKGALFINTSRGEVVDEGSLIRHTGEPGKMVLDVWSGEPLINKKLLRLTDIATPHIAGYSLEGKINATVMSVKALADFFSIEPLKDFKIEIPVFDYTPYGENFLDKISDALKNTFDIVAEDFKLKRNPELFEKLRGGYHLRREIPKELFES